MKRQYLYNTSIKTTYSEPFKTPITIPGIVELEEFDKGGEGVAFHDTDMDNSGNVYCSLEGVDLFSIAGGGYGVGWTHSGEWMQYTVNVKEGENMMQQSIMLLFQQLL